MVASGLVDQWGPLNAPPATRRADLVTAINSCRWELGNGLEAALATWSRCTTRRMRQLVVATWRIVDLNMHDCTTGQRQSTCFHGKDPQAGYTCLTC